MLKSWKYFPIKYFIEKNNNIHVIVQLPCSHIVKYCLLVRNFTWINSCWFCTFIHRVIKPNAKTSQPSYVDVKFCMLFVEYTASAVGPFIKGLSVPDELVKVIIQSANVGASSLCSGRCACTRVLSWPPVTVNGSVVNVPTLHLLCCCADYTPTWRLNLTPIYIPAAAPEKLQCCYALLQATR
jgi:hypothetical protein